MIGLNILIKTLDDTEPSWPDMTNSNSVVGQLQGASILEGGMESGKSSVGFRIALPDGKYALVETSSELLKNLHAVLLGAEARFADLKMGRL